MVAPGHNQPLVVFILTFRGVQGGSILTKGLARNTTKKVVLGFLLKSQLIPDIQLNSSAWPFLTFLVVKLFINHSHVLGIFCDLTFKSVFTFVHPSLPNIKGLAVN